MNLTEKLQMERLRSGAMRVIFIISNLALFITKIVDIIKNLLFLALGNKGVKTENDYRSTNRKTYR